ncbi:hypothetical protein [Conexibacter sp. CPCC 206217]|uniref:hypothetical protein n=1 Tax=Conexibacter sp. CPCC 206217 TaxID=3064574 RepID=UPI00271E1B71|nr:hypothetical protein [Conexibacter sp. CPCC 206217]MDO8210075.1 hypothetical protein [Conexibacter sp. CPCC 206217]
MSVRACQLGLRIAAGAFIAVAFMLPIGAAAAQAEVRHANLLDPPDPAVTFDMSALDVTFDRAASTLTVELDLHQPLPALLPSPDQQVTIALGEHATATADAGCRLEPPESTGDVRLTIAAGPLGDALVATATVAPNGDPLLLPVALSPDRSRLSLTLRDPLLAQAQPRCVEARAHGLVADLPLAPSDPAQPPADDLLSGWFDGYAPAEPGEPRGPGDPDPGPSGDQPPSPAPPAPPSVGASPPAPTSPTVATRSDVARACRTIATPALTWREFPRELAVRATATVPVQARRDRRVEDVVATVTTFRAGAQVGEPARIALPARGYALQLRAPARTGRLTVALAWVERRGSGAGTPCPQRSDPHETTVVQPLEPRLQLARDPDRLSLAWGARGRDCHALQRRALDVQVEGLGYTRSYRVTEPCAGWGAPGAALPDIAARRAGAALRLTPRGEDSGSWSYRMTARTGARVLLQGLLVVTVGRRDGAVWRTIRFVPDRPPH